VPTVGDCFVLSVAQCLFSLQVHADGVLFCLDLGVEVSKHDSTFDCKGRFRCQVLDLRLEVWKKLVNSMHVGSAYDAEDLHMLTQLGVVVLFLEMINDSHCLFQMLCVEEILKCVLESSVESSESERRQQ